MDEREAFAVLLNIEGVRPAGERSPVVCLTELVILPGVDEFVPDGFAELLPPALFGGRLG